MSSKINGSEFSVLAVLSWSTVGCLLTKTMKRFWWSVARLLSRLRTKFKSETRSLYSLRPESLTSQWVTGARSNARRARAGSRVSDYNFLRRWQ